MTGRREKKAMQLALGTQKRGAHASTHDMRASGRRSDADAEADHAKQLEELLAPYLEAQAQQFPYEQVEDVLAAIEDLGTQEGNTSAADELPVELDEVLTQWLRNVRKDFQNGFLSILTAAAIAAFSRTFAQLVQQFDLTLQPGPEMLARMREWSRQRLAEFLDKLERILMARIIRIITKGLRHGRPLKDIAGEIGLFLDKRRERAEQIAKDETSEAYAHGVYEAQRTLGAKTKQWHTAEDISVCAICTRNSAQGPIPIAQPFQSGDQHPLAHPWCRCRLTYSGITRESVLQTF